MLAKLRRNRLRRMMRGYRRLKSEGRLELVSVIKQELTVTPAFRFVTTDKFFSSLDVQHHELSIRQFLISRRVSLSLGEAVLESFGEQKPLKFGIPQSWRNVVRSHGVSVDEGASTVRWVAFIILQFSISVLRIIKAIASSLSEVWKPRLEEIRYAYFDTLSERNLTTSQSQREVGGILNWYSSWVDRDKGVELLKHSVRAVDRQETRAGLPVRYLPSAIQPLSTWKATALFIRWAVLAIMTAFWSWFSGKWWYSIMLGEAAKAAQVYFQDPKYLGREYFFHNSNWIYRPLWTYPAEKKGARIIFYFYSTNFEHLKLINSEYPVEYGWKSATWSHYLVWDRYQADFIARLGAQPVIQQVGPIAFENETDFDINFQKKSLAVFDVQPVRDSIYQRLAMAYEYYVPRTACKFLTDIVDVAKEVRAPVILKRKRPAPGIVHRQYLAALRKLVSETSLQEINPTVSPRSLIHKCSAVISMPYTSTALIARDLGKPTVYYDPYGQCDKNDRAAHGITVISEKSELREWLINAVR